MGRFVFVEERARTKNPARNPKVEVVARRDPDEPSASRRTLPSGLWAIRIQLVAFAKGRLFVGITEVQLRMAPLRLKHIGPFAELT
jgi:hypothetical protein